MVSRRKDLVILGLLLIWGLPRVALGNLAVPSMFGWGAPFFLSAKTVGGVFAGIVLIEAVAFRAVAGFGWKKCFLAALLANFVSSLIGLMAAYINGLLLMLMLIASPLPIGYLIREKNMQRANAAP
ncbi:MAG: hypothetical protein IIB64_04420 [Proteobacteria bacterium]|nr:hypothetical protein [Pseudomonadota bacterium]